MGRIVENKALSMLDQGSDKVSEFIEDYFSLINAPIKRIIDDRTDIGFANDVVFQQSVIEVVKILKRINELNVQSNTVVKEEISDILISAK
jgi:hypothetical protein